MVNFIHIFVLYSSKCFPFLIYCFNELHKFINILDNLERHVDKRNWIYLCCTLLKINKLGAGESSYCRGPEFSSQHSHQVSPNRLELQLQGADISLTSLVTHTDMHTYTQITKIKISKLYVRVGFAKLERRRKEFCTCTHAHLPWCWCCAHQNWCTRCVFPYFSEFSVLRLALA